MASVNFSGQLDRPLNEEAAGGDKIYFYPLNTVGEIIQSAASIMTIDESGNYDITLGYNNYSLYYYSDVSKKQTYIANVTVSADTVVSTLPDLIGSTTPVTEEAELIIQGYLSDAANYATAAETARDEALAAVSSGHNTLSGRDEDDAHPATAIDVYDGSNVESELDSRGFSLKERLGVVAAKCAKGESINFCAYGDSTTDGNNTTDWVANTADTNHNDDAPNAWPVKLQEMLREIYSNENINVWNAGYSATRMDSGFAVQNYDSLVIDNPYYGTPDVLFIGFGLNDIKETDFLSDHIEQTRILIERVIGDGTVPVLVTNDPTKRVIPTNSDIASNDDRSSIDSVTQINRAKIDLASQYGIPLVDTNEMMKRWIQNNNDGYTWYDLQTDGLHFNDVGHRFKAQVFLSYIYNNLVKFDGGVKHIESWDSASNLTVDYSDVLNGTSSRQGALIDISSGVTSESDIMTLRIFNECPNAYIVYRGMGSEGYDDDVTYTVSPSISGYSYLSESSESYSLPTIGRNSGTGVLFHADQYFILGKLDYGLNKITYTSGDSGMAKVGFFSVFESEKTLPQNALSESGKQYYRFTQNEGNKIYFAEENSNLSNVSSYMTGGSAEILMTIECPQNTGVIIASTKSYGNNDAKTYDRRVYTTIYRGDNDRFELRVGLAGDDGVINSLTNVFSSNNLWSDDLQELCYTQTRESDGTVTHTVYDSYDKSNAVITYSQPTTSNYMLSYNGIFGGAFSETDSILSDALVVIHEAVIVR